MVDWFILGLVGLLILLFIFKNQSFDSAKPPASTPAPAPGPPPKYTQTMMIQAGGSCPDSTWTKIGTSGTICAK